MVGGVQRHLDEFGNCTCGNPSGDIEPMEFEVYDEMRDRYRTKRVPACADCFGLL